MTDRLANYNSTRNIIPSKIDLLLRYASSTGGPIGCGLTIIGYLILSTGRNVGMITDGGFSSERSKISPGSAVRNLE